MEPVTVNINHEVKVRLTAFGLHIAARHKFFTLTNFNFVPETMELKVPLWELMSVFGEHIQMGNLELPFERNEIHFTGRY